MPLLVISSYLLAQPGAGVNSVYSNMMTYKAKKFIIDSILGPNSASETFVVEALAGSKSTEISTMYFENNNSSEKGLIFGFYDDFWDKNGAGVSFKGYGFRHVEYAEAVTLLDKIDKIITSYSSYLSADQNSNNIYFNFEDLLFLIYMDGGGKIRIFYEGFDAEWDYQRFLKTKNRFKKASE